MIREILNTIDVKWFMNLSKKEILEQVNPRNLSIVKDYRKLIEQERMLKIRDRSQFSDEIEDDEDAEDWRKHQSIKTTWSNDDMTDEIIEKTSDVTSRSLLGTLEGDCEWIDNRWRGNWELWLRRYIWTEVCFLLPPHSGGRRLGTPGRDPTTSEVTITRTWQDFQWRHLLREH